MRGISSVTHYFLSSTCKKACKKIYLGQVVTIVLRQVVTTVTTLGRLRLMAMSASYVLTLTEGSKRI